MGSAPRYPTPSSFPQTPAPVFDSPAVFEKFDTDSLFFIFYYQQGTCDGRLIVVCGSPNCYMVRSIVVHGPRRYQQYLAA